MILPASGGQRVLPTFARKPLFGYSSMVYRNRLDRLPELHRGGAPHVPTVGCRSRANCSFMYATMLIAVPTGVKVFNWSTTMFKGSMTFETRCCSRSRSSSCSRSAASRPELSAGTADFHYHTPISWWRTSTTCWCRCAFALFAASTTGAEVTGHMYDEGLSKATSGMTFIGVNTAFPDALRRPRRHAAPHPTTRCSSPTSTALEHRCLHHGLSRS